MGADGEDSCQCHRSQMFVIRTECNEFVLISVQSVADVEITLELKREKLFRKIYEYASHSYFSAIHKVD